MLTWILLAVLVLALFGVINLDNIRDWSIEKSKEAWPHVRGYLSTLSEKIDSAKAKVENSKNKIKNNLDDAQNKIEDYQDDEDDRFNNN